MKKYIQHDPWKIVEDDFHPDFNRNSESLFSIGNGRFGQRANFEETYTGDTMAGNYVAGVYYPDKTRVGWWKNGYPEYFAKVLNATSWIDLEISVGEELLDLATWKVVAFERVLDMKRGVLSREFEAISPGGSRIKVKAQRLCSLADDETACLEYTIESVNYAGDISIHSIANGNVRNEDANYDEQFWDHVETSSEKGLDCVTVRTKKTGFLVTTASQTHVSLEGSTLLPMGVAADKKASSSYQGFLEKGQMCTISKFVAIVSTQNYKEQGLIDAATTAVQRAEAMGIEGMVNAQQNAWAETWDLCDIVIDGDVSAQQGIRFNIFQLFQTYTGTDSRLNIGPKGFTGEKYGGSTYWDTEAYCLPFYLSTASHEVARNLLQYRYEHLVKAIENAEKLGFTNGAALYPMVTMNGEECHNEWEITFEEIHRNGAIAYAIFDYTRYTGDETYVLGNGLEVLVGITRFWAQRVNWSDQKSKYVMLGVTGPNEYENNVNNNWYTNKMATWTLHYTISMLSRLNETQPEAAASLLSKLGISPEEKSEWEHIVAEMYYPESAEKGVFLQQDGFLDKELLPVSELPAEHLPLNQNWSWDRILRSCYIKQADVLQGMYFFEDEFRKEVLERNFDFYEPITVHESSLSPCIHAILASRLGKEEKAYEMYLRTARLDLDDYNNDTEDGCHITSMAGTWMAVTKGFGGMRVYEDHLAFHPFLPGDWQRLEFHISYKGARLLVEVTKSEATITNTSEQPCGIALFGERITLAGKDTMARSLP